MSSQQADRSVSAPGSSAKNQDVLNSGNGADTASCYQNQPSMSSTDATDGGLATEGSACTTFNNPGPLVDAGSCSQSLTGVFESVNTQRGNSAIICTIIARLTSMDQMLLITGNMIEVGRNSSTSHVDFHVSNKFVSRKHFIIQHGPKDEFNLLCLSKNGLFIDNKFYQKSTVPYKLQRSCIIRFRSTKTWIMFDSLIEQDTPIDLRKTTAVGLPRNHAAEISSAEPVNGLVGDEQRYMHGDVNSSAESATTGMISVANSSIHPRQNPSVDVRKPPNSYAQLIVQAILAAPEEQLTLAEIYSSIAKKHKFYAEHATKSWQNSIRHNLSLNRYFVKVPRSPADRGKGCFWRVDPLYVPKLMQRRCNIRDYRKPLPRSPLVSIPQSVPDGLGRNSKTGVTGTAHVHAHPYAQDGEDYAPDHKRQKM